jgi:S-formylglutathione hydrolase FrmB
MKVRVLGRATLVLGAVLATTGRAQASRLFDFDFGSASYPTSGTVNNVTISLAAGGTLAGIIDKDGAASSLSLRVSAPFNSSTANTDGTQSPASTVPFPPSATRDNFFGNTVTFNSQVRPSAQLEISGLDPNGTYDFLFFASRMGVTDNRDTAYHVAGANTLTVDLNPSANTTLVASASGIHPLSTGIIRVDLSPGPANKNSYGFYYIGAMRITETLPNALPSPSPSPSPSPTVSPTPSPTPSPAAPPVTQFSLTNTLTGLQISATSNESGNVYYAVFTRPMGSLTGADVKAYATSATDAVRVAGGVLAAPTPGTNVSAGITTLADKSLYSVYAAMETSDGGLDPSAYRVDGVLPRKISMQQYATAVAGKNGAIVRYLATVPADYYAHPEKRYPVLMYIHGNGETFNSATNDESYFTTNSRTRMDKTPLHARIRFGKEVPYILIAPQCNSALWNCTNMTDTAYTSEVLRKALATYRADPKRVYVTGMSYGGSGTWALANDYPSLVTAIVPISGSFYRSTSTVCTNFAGTNRIAVWAMHNQNDTVFSYTGNRDQVARVKACPGASDARFTLFDGTTYPATATTNHHATAEYVLNAPYVDYGPTPVVVGTTLIPLAPELVRDLSIAQSDFRSKLGDPSLVIDEIYDWLGLWSKP